MADLEAIAENLSSLTVIEAANLVKLLEDKWGVSAAAPVAVAAGAAPTPTVIVTDTLRPRTGMPARAVVDQLPLAVNPEHRRIGQARRYLGPFTPRRKIAPHLRRTL